MDDAGARLRRHAVRQIVDQRLHRRHMLGFGAAILLRPAAHLPLKIVAGSPEIAEPYSDMVGVVQVGQRVDHRVVVRGAPFRRQVGHRAVPDGAPVHHFHDVEHRSDHVVVGAQPALARHRKAGGVQRRHHSVLAIDLMRAGKKLPHRLATQDVFGGRSGQLVRRVRLAAGELGVAERTRIPRHVRLHPRIQAVEVQPVALRHLRLERRVRRGTAHCANMMTLRVASPLRSSSNAALIPSSPMR